MDPHSAFALRARLMLAALLATASLQLHAQLPRIASLSAAPASAASVAATTKESDLPMQRLRERAKTLAAEIAQLESPGGLAVGAPPGTPDEELAERLSTVQFAANAVNQNLEFLRRLETLGAARDDLQARLDAWRGLEEKPPYSIEFVDGLRGEQLGAGKRVAALMQQRKTTAELAARAVEQVKQAEVALRQAQERLEKGGNGPDAARLAWLRQLAQLRVRSAQAMAGRSDAEVRLIEVNLTEARLEAELAGRRYQGASDAASFDEAELRRIRASLDEQATQIDRADKRLLAAAADKLRSLAKARGALEGARGATVKGETAEAATARIRAAERQVDLARAEVNTTGQRVDLTSQERDLLQLSRTIWEARFALAGDRSSAALLKARDQLRRIDTGVALAREYYAQQRDEVRRRVEEVDRRSKGAGLAPEELAYLKSLRGSHASLLEDLDRSAGAVESAAALSARYGDDIEGARPITTVADRVSDGAAWLRDGASRLSSAELFAIEDSIDVDGQRISGTRSITVGKVSAAIVILVLGYSLVKLVLKLGTRIAVRRLKADANYANLLSRWMLWFSVVILVVIALVLVKIPLTVFAFLGGAVAIGFGFGMQNLIKNLMSGLMILGERPFRLGDHIIVGDRGGTVTSIDLRSTTIIDVDGIETLIPNSTFIEQNVTNWTYTNRRVRYAIKVGVAYGSPVRTVMDVLRQTADRHGHVLKAPPPEVLFVDFGADALQFVLHYWLDLGASTSREVSSDLRAMIDAAFAEADIVMAFPQRDVHVDAARPIPVRVVEGASEASAGP